jgi:pyrroline-5-carboxylate reductase
MARTSRLTTVPHRRAALRRRGAGGHTLGFLGAGNMASALIRGLLRAGLHRAGELWVTDVDAAQRRRVARRFGVASAPNNQALVAGSRIVVLAVKPQVMDAVLAEIRPAVRPATLFISIAAGVPLGRIERGLGPSARVVRVMPNTPALVGRGAAVVVAGRHATPTDVAKTLGVFRAVGDAVALRREALLDAVTGLSGSGPAFVYLFAEGLIAGGCRGGLPRPLAARLAYQTIDGAAAMLRETGKSPAELRAMVTSPGGTTLAGLASLESGGFLDCVRAAVGAATARARALARG